MRFIKTVIAKARSGRAFSPLLEASTPNPLYNWQSGLLGMTGLLTVIAKSLLDIGFSGCCGRPTRDFPRGSYKGVRFLNKEILTIAHEPK
jgi:hypothetical protein